jgi:hypothetical protein
MSITGCRNDALVTLLNAEGYQPLILPRSGLVAPWVYTYKQRKLAPQGPLSDFLPAGTPAPPRNSGQLGDIEHRETDNKSTSAAGSFLGDALKCIGITSAPKLDLSFAEGHDIAFSFEEVTFDGLDVSKVKQLMALVDFSTYAKEEQAYLYIAYEFAFAGKLMMRSSSSFVSSADGKAFQIGTYFDLGAQGQAKMESETTISFSAKNGVTAAFACKIGRLEKRVKGWFFFATEDGGEGFLADEGKPKPFLLERGVVLRVEEE